MPTALLPVTRIAAAAGGFTAFEYGSALYANRGVVVAAQGHQPNGRTEPPDRVLGVVLVIRPGREILGDPAAVLALGSGILSGVSLVATNQLAETEPPSRTLIYNFGISSLLLLPVLLLEWRPLDRRAWLLLVGVGVFYALTQWLIILAYRYASASELSPFNYSVVIFSGLLGWLFYGNLPSSTAVAGTLLICGAGILSISSGHQEGQGHWFGSGHWHWPWKQRSLEKRIGGKWEIVS